MTVQSIQQYVNARQKQPLRTAVSNALETDAALCNQRA
jgi:hypothetical protein